MSSLEVRLFRDYELQFGLTSYRSGGGGFVPGIVFNPSEEGLAYVRTDIGGAYRLNLDDTWTPLTDFVGNSNWYHCSFLPLWMFYGWVDNRAGIDGVWTRSPQTLLTQTGCILPLVCTPTSGTRTTGLYYAPRTKARPGRKQRCRLKLVGTCLAVGWVR